MRRDSTGDLTLLRPRRWEKVRAVNFGVGEIIILVFVLIVVFSAARMGQLGNAVGKFVYSFKKASRGEGFVDAGRGSTRLGGGSSRRGERGDRGTEDAQFVEGEKKN